MKMKPVLKCMSRGCDVLKILAAVGYSSFAELYAEPDPTAALLERLEAVQPNGKGWRARCPCPDHPDNDPSLQVARGTAAIEDGCDQRRHDHDQRHDQQRRRRRNDPDPPTIHPTRERAIEAAAWSVRQDRKDKWRLAHTYIYQSADGREAFRQLRFEDDNGHKEMRPVSPVDGGWVVKALANHRPLYRLPELLASQGLVVVTEGEKAVEAARAIGLVATTAAGGSNAPLDKTDLTPLAGRRVAVLPDADPPGQKLAKNIARALLKLNPPADVRIVELPDAGPGGDIADFIEEDRDGHTSEEIYDEIVALADEAFAKPAEVVEETETPVSSSHDGANLTQIIAEQILSEHQYARDAGGKLYVFKGGVYCRQGERHVRARVKRLLTVPDAPGCWTSYRANEVFTFIEIDAQELWERPPRNRVNVLNGILDIDARKLLAHDPKSLSSVQLPVTYDPAAKCPKIDQFVNETFPEDAIEIAYQIAALLMIPVSHQVAVLLLGSGGNGKSRYLELLRAFIGRSNTAALSLHKLESDRFAVARLMGKLAKICPDLPSEHLASTAMFKAISGGDEVPAEYKFKDGFDFRPFARLVFSANSPPRSTDSSDAFFRRWVVISFDRTFEGEDLIPEQELDARLQDPAELSGLLNRALEMLPQVVKYGITVTDSMTAAWEDFRETTDSMAVWLDKHTTDLTGTMIAKDELRKAFNNSADASGSPRMTAKAFNKALLKLRPHLTEAQRTVQGLVKWVWLGIGLGEVE